MKDATKTRMVANANRESWFWRRWGSWA
jgi:hypothetical protein